MKALVKKYAEPGIWMEDVPIPEIGVNDVLIKIWKVAICGTDLHIYNWDQWSQNTIKTPMTIGHEYVGEIVKVGSGVKNYKIGDRVTGEGHIACGHCRNCRRGREHICENSIGVGVNRDGAFAEYLSIPASNVVKVDPRIPDDFMAIMDPFGNATHTALSFPLLGEDVLITGAGLIGTMATAICKFAGARNIVVTDLSEYRLNIAKKMGATLCVNPTQGGSVAAAMHELGLKGFDVGLEMSGSGAAFHTMISVMRNGGKISLLGLGDGPITVDMNQVIGKGLTLQGIYGRKMDNWHQMSYMVQGGLDLSPVITHRFHYTEFQKGFDAMMSGKSGKVVLDWTK